MDRYMYQIGACYIRVSTDEQTEYSPDAQLKALKKYAKEHDIILNKEFIFIDEGISGRRADKRPAFQRMIAASKLKPRLFDVILVHKFDRFARSREDSVVYKSLLKKESGIKVISITESIEDDKFSVILEAILEAMAEYYSLNLSDEVKKGMTEKASRGEYQTTPAFGYKMVDKNLIIVKEEAKIVRLIFEEFTSQKRNMRQLAIYINDLGIRTHRGNTFESRTIEYILNNPLYISKVRWTPTERARRNYNHPDTIIAEGSHEPIITKELFNKAQEILKDNKEQHRKFEKSTTNKRSWLCGLVRCANCNKMLVVSQKNYFQCNGYVKGQCTVSNLVRYKALEELVANQLKITFDEKLNITTIPSNVVTSNNEYELLNISLDKLKVREERAKIAYQDGIDSLEEYKESKLKIKQERARLLDELKMLKNELISSSDVDLDMYKKIESVYDLLTDDSVDIMIKYQTAHMLIHEIIFSKTEKVLKIVYK